jgi:uncharacterized RDD family membrane protein YckC
VRVAPPSNEPAAPQPAAYASFLARFRALVVDAAVLVAATLSLVFAAGALDAPGAGRAAVAGLVALTVLYEPLLVSRFGATVGHRLCNLRIVSERTGQRPAFWAAFVRFAVKSALGLPSFVFMALTRRHQALHDRVAGTTVRIRDLDRARDYDFAWERSEAEIAPAGLPSRARRVAAIIAYVAISSVVLSMTSVRVVPEACILTAACTPGDELRLQVVGAAWLAAVALCVIAGWRGRLWGARSRSVVASAWRRA